MGGGNNLSWFSKSWILLDKAWQNIGKPHSSSTIILQEADEADVQLYLGHSSQVKWETNYTYGHMHAHNCCLCLVVLHCLSRIYFYSRRKMTSSNGKTKMQNLKLRPSFPT